MQKPGFFRLCETLLIVLWFPAAAFQLPKIPNLSSVPGQPSVSVGKDSYGRETPHGTVLNFVRYAHHGDFNTAAKFLQLSPAEQKQEGEELARELLTLMDTNFVGSISMMSDSPEGRLDDDPDPDIEVVGKFVVNKQEAKFLLVRLPQKDTGPIWLVSEQTLDQVPFLYESVGSPALDRYFPSVLAETSFLGISLGRWLVLLLSLPLALLLGWTMSRCASWLWRIRKPSSLSVGRDNKTSLRKPIAMMLAILLHGVFVMLIGIPIYYRVYYFRLSAALLVLCIAWLGSRILDEAYRRGDLRTSSNSEIRSFLQLAHQLLRVSLFSLAVLFVLACLGIDTKAILAGVGIGGIALALGAQKTLENLFGGITLVMDKVFAVGDDCVISNRQVTVREIGLRSITMSTREGTEISFPNGTLAQNSIENLSRRTKFLISATVSVSYESKLAQFGEAIAQIRAMLSSHDRIEQKTARFCLSGLSSLGYEIELFAYVRGADIAEFSTIREEVLFRVLEILESFGATVAIPAQMNYVSRKPPTSKPETSETGSALESLQSGKGGSR